MQHIAVGRQADKPELNYHRKGTKRSDNDYFYIIGESIAIVHFSWGRRGPLGQAGDACHCLKMAVNEVLAVLIWHIALIML